jgi:hypothetical protein
MGGGVIEFVELVGGTRHMSVGYGWPVLALKITWNIYVNVSLLIISTLM